MSDRDDTTLMLQVHSSRLVSTSQLCILPECLLSDSSCPDHRHTASKLHFLFQSISQRAQIINIYCTSSPASILLPQHLLQPPSLRFICCWCILRLSPSFSFLLSLSLFFTHTLCFLWELQFCVSTPLFGTLLPLLLLSSLPSSSIKSPALTIRI